MKKARTDAGRQRGMAMMMAIVAIVILTVVATELAYNARVDLEMATNQRDEVRAYYLARSGIGLSRLVLRFQKQLDSAPPNLGSMMDSFKGLFGGSAAPGQTATTPSATGAPGTTGTPAATGMNIQIWQLAKIDCYLLQGLMSDDSSSGGLLASSSSASHSSSRGKAPSRLSSKASEFDLTNPELAAKQASVSFGDFKGCFQAHISPEEPKLNLNKLNSPQFTSQAVVARLLDMLNDKRFEFLFEKEDANHVKSNAQEMVLAVRDWIDEDDTQSTLNLTGQGEPFLKGFADEAALYDKYNPRYMPKNALFDSLDELYMVQGWNDRMLAAFRDRITVYPDINTPPNINTDDPVLLYMAILSVMDPLHPDPRLSNPMFVDELIRRVRSAKMFSFLGMSAADFITLVASTGIQVNPTITANLQGNRFIGDKNTTYTITSVGQAGSVEKTLTAIVRMDDNGLGRLLFWKEQ